MKRWVVLVADSKDIDKFHSIFGEKWWNDTEDIYCIPVRFITKDQQEKLGIPNLDWHYYEYLICDPSNFVMSI